MSAADAHSSVSGTPSAWLLLALSIGLIAVWRAASYKRERHRTEEKLRAEGEETLRLVARTRLLAEERERIYSDLHDDIGAKLLDLIYSAERPDTADLARSILQDLRDVVSRSRGTPGTLLEVLGEIRAECEDRLERIDAERIWDQRDELPDPQLDHGQSLHLFRIVREAVSNAIRHAQARRLRIRVRHNHRELLLDVTDDGPGLSSDPGSGGIGTENMRSRAAELKGTIRWDPGTHGGTKVLLRMPLG